MAGYTRLYGFVIAGFFCFHSACALPQPRGPAEPYSLPQYASDRTARAKGVEEKNASLLYGPGTGGGPWSPTGSLGAQLVQNDFNITMQSLNAEEVLISDDQNRTESNITRYNGLKSVQDYTKLYEDDNWALTTAPTGIAPGILNNYTSDLLFSMQRLSFSPFFLRRLDPRKDKMPFLVEDGITSKLTGLGFQDLFVQGRLFYADYRLLAGYALNNQGTYSAYTEGLFYICPLLGDFLPLAIRTNANNKSLIYTPADHPDDWLLAKMMFNVDDFIMEAFHHLANTHYVSEIVYEAALKTLSDDHPILALMARAMYGAFGIRPLAVQTLFGPGGVVESFTPWTGLAIENLTSWFYFHGGAGGYHDNYFRTNLRRRGLIDNAHGPALQHFPFYEDASAIHGAQEQFVQAFVASYYSADADIAADNELQAWLAEANGGAQIISFPNATTLATRHDLVELLTHFFHLTTTAHHAINLNQVLTASAVLPLNPTAMYQPIPTSKGVHDVASYLPPFAACVGIIETGADFARPLFAHGPRSMVHLFDDEAMLARMNDATRAANGVFKTRMQQRSADVASRHFDADGLSQGMPFVWQALDPEVMLFSTTI